MSKPTASIGLSALFLLGGAAVLKPPSIEFLSHLLLITGGLLAVVFIAVFMAEPGA